MSGLYIVQRELRAIVRLPQTYAIGAAYLIISGIFFINILISTELPDLAQYYANVASTLLVLVPIVAMRSFAEERRSGVLDITLSWPIPRTGLVLGKFAANTIYVWVLSSIVWLYFWLVGNLGSIQTSRTIGGFTGLLLMAATFSALALMVSARASSPTTAGFLGFGLLLFLWILDYAPGWIGERLRWLGPASHFDSFPRGLIYWQDVAYFVILSVIGLGLAVSALDREHPGQAFRSGVRRAMAFSLVVVVWGGGSAFARDLTGKVDLTPTKEHTITDVTKKVLRGVKGPLRLTGYAAPIGEDEHRMESLVRQYRAAGADVRLQVIDPDAQPAKAHQAGIKLYGQVLVELGDRREVIESATQPQLTSALFRLSRSSSPRVCFTIGHGERNILDQARDGISTLAADLRGLFFDVKPLALDALGADSELRQCAAVVVAGPRVPLLSSEVTLLSDFARRDGRLLVLTDGTEGPRAQLNEFLAPWGLAIRDGIVADLSSLADDPSSIVSDNYPSAAPPTVSLRERDLPVVLVNALPIEPLSGMEDQFIPLVRSSPKSWNAPSPQAGARKGPFVVAALMDRGHLTGDEHSPSVARTRIGVTSVDIASNRVVELFGNREFVTGLVQWIAHEDDLIGVDRPSSRAYKLVLTEAQKNRLIRQGIVFPTTVVLLPLPIALLRLRRG